MVRVVGSVTRGSTPGFRDSSSDAVLSDVESGLSEVDVLLPSSDLVHPITVATINNIIRVILSKRINRLVNLLFFIFRNLLI
jgi:hypothetical protein